MPLGGSPMGRPARANLWILKALGMCGRWCSWSKAPGAVSTGDSAPGSKPCGQTYKVRQAERSKGPEWKSPTGAKVGWKPWGWGKEPPGLTSPLEEALGVAQSVWGSWKKWQTDMNRPIRCSLLLLKCKEHLKCNIFLVISLKNPNSLAGHVAFH
jgi:hypothetical protein